MPRNYREAAPPGCPLTNRQFQVLSLMSSGLTKKEVAQELGITDSTVRSHLEGAKQKLDLVSRGTVCVLMQMKDSGWLGAAPKPPQQPDDSRDATPVQLAYNFCFVDLCQKRTVRAACIVTVAFGLLSAVHRIPTGVRQVPDIDALLLRMARGLMRPIPE